MRQHPVSRVRSGVRRLGRRALFALSIALLAALPACDSKSEEPAKPAKPTSVSRPGAPASAEGREVATDSGIVMVLLPGGTFSMGNSGGEDDEQPARQVRIAPFSIDKFEVTQAQYEAITGRNPSKWQAPERPVERVSWLFAVRYCNARSLKEGLKPCYDADTLECDLAADGYRLPTEAEWEYACRAGTTGDFSFGSDPARLGQYAWFGANSGDETHPVGQKDPNAWGLYDMHGNVAEWCQDYYDEGYYSQGQNEDPAGPAQGDERVLRGGSWSNTADACRSSARYSEPPGFADVCFGYEAYGFRCVRRAAPAGGP